MHSGLPYVGLEDIESGTARFSGSLSPSSVKSTTFRFTPAHVLYGRLRPYLNKVLAPDFEGHCSTEIFPLKPLPNVLREFIVYWLLRDATVTQATETARGARMPRANVEEMLEFEFPLPPLDEQRRIVAILDDAFEGIAKARANAERNIENARAIFEIELAAVFTRPNDRSVARHLQDVCHEITVGHVGSMASKYQESGIPFLRSQNIRPFEVLLENVVYIDEAFHGQLKKSQLRPGDVAIVRTGYPGTAAVIPDSLPVCNCSDLVIVRPGTDVDSHYLALFFNSRAGKEMVAGRLVGAAQRHFNVTAAKQVFIAIPPLSEQRNLVKKLNVFGRESQRLETTFRRKLAAHDELKASLLHHAFAGEL